MSTALKFRQAGLALLAVRKPCQKRQEITVLQCRVFPLLETLRLFLREFGEEPQSLIYDS
jgi:hypothetical protein